MVYLYLVQNWVLVLSWTAIIPYSHGIKRHGISLAKVRYVRPLLVYKIDNMAFRNQDDLKFRTLD